MYGQRRLFKRCQLAGNSIRFKILLKLQIENEYRFFLSEERQNEVLCGNKTKPLWCKTIFFLRRKCSEICFNTPVTDVVVYSVVSRHFLPCRAASIDVFTHRGAQPSKILYFLPPPRPLPRPRPLPPSPPPPRRALASLIASARLSNRETDCRASFCFFI